MQGVGIRGTVDLHMGVVGPVGVCLKLFLVLGLLASVEHVFVLEALTEVAEAILVCVQIDKRRRIFRIRVFLDVVVGRVEEVVWEGVWVWVVVLFVVQRVFGFNVWVERS